MDNQSNFTLSNSLLHYKITAYELSFFIMKKGPLINCIILVLFKPNKKITQNKLHDYCG